MVAAATRGYKNQKKLVENIHPSFRPSIPPSSSTGKRQRQKPNAQNRNASLRTTTDPAVVTHHYLLPVLIALVVLARLLRAVGRVARVARAGADDVVAGVAVSLRPLVVGLARLGWLEEGRGVAGGRVDGGRGLGGSGPPGLGGSGGRDRGGRFLGAGNGCGSLVIRVLVPTNLFLGRGGCAGEAMSAFSPLIQTPTPPR